MKQTLVIDWFTVSLFVGCMILILLVRYIWHS